MWQPHWYQENEAKRRAEARENTGECVNGGTAYRQGYVLLVMVLRCCIVRPGVVLYEEGLDSEVVENAVLAIRQADTLIVGGTSLVVYPAAGLIDYFHGRHLILINKTETKASSRWRSSGRRWAR